MEKFIGYLALGIIGGYLGFLLRRGYKAYKNEIRYIGNDRRPPRP